VAKWLAVAVAGVGPFAVAVAIANDVAASATATSPAAAGTTAPGATPALSALQAAAVRSSWPQPVLAPRLQKAGLNPPTVLQLRCGFPR